MTKYKLHIVGTQTLPETRMTDDDPPVEVNHTSGVDLWHELEADSHAEAKVAFKAWVAERFINSNAIGFVGVVSAWTIAESQILDEVPFSVEVEITQNVVVDF